MAIKELFNLEGKVAIITGASKGIGESMARGLAEFGASVVVSSRNQEAVEAVAADFRSHGFNARGISCHVGDEKQLDNLVEKTVSEYGGVDILINNAAINPTFSPLQENGVEIFDKVMSVNVRACHSLANRCYLIMKDRGGGSIINIASVEGLKPSQGLGIYSVSKAALIMLTKSQAKEWGPDGIRVNAICPGLIKTKFSSALWQNEKLLNELTNYTPSGRMALPDEMAGLAVYLSSAASSFTTGAIITSDGGHMIAGA